MGRVVHEYTSKIKPNVEEVVKDLSYTGAAVIIDSTPVDTTKAVANWKVAQGAPFGGIVGERVAGSKKGSGSTAAKAQMKAEAYGRIATFKNAVPLFISNRVPYIGVLEYGDSKHRPHGMVSKGLQAMRLRAKSLRILKPQKT